MGDVAFEAQLDGGWVMITSSSPRWPQLEAPMTELASTTVDAKYIRRYAQVGAILTAITAISSFFYFAATPEGPQRLALELMCVPAVLMSMVVMLVANRLVGTRWETWFFYSFSGSALLIITTVAILDGGSSSPLSVILILPVVYTSISYPLAAVRVIAAVAQSSMLALMIVGHDWDARAWLQFIVLAVFNILAVASGANREAYQESSRELAARAMHDDLTGCLSYGAFNDCLRVETARATRTSRPFTLLIADVDHFKSINDSFGHPTGDEVLRLLVEVLTVGTRAEDAVGRLGGDEFGVLLVDTQTDGALAQAERLRVMMRNIPVRAQVTVSIGMATWTGPHDTAAEVLRRADTALYAAKAAGRDRTLCDECAPPLDQRAPLAFSASARSPRSSRSLAEHCALIREKTESSSLAK